MKAHKSLWLTSYIRVRECQWTYQVADQEFCHSYTPFTFFKQCNRLHYHTGNQGIHALKCNVKCEGYPLVANSGMDKQNADGLNKLAPMHERWISPETDFNYPKPWCQVWISTRIIEYVTTNSLIRSKGRKSVAEECHWKLRTLGQDTSCEGIITCMACKGQNVALTRHTRACMGH